MLSNIIAGFIIIIVGTALLPIVANQAAAGIGYTNASGTFFPGNITGASVAITGLIQVFFALAITAAAIAVCISGLKGAGLM